MEQILYSPAVIDYPHVVAVIQRQRKLDQLWADNRRRYNLEQNKRQKKQ